MTSGEHTNGADLLALADRVEKLTGPDRKIDAAIGQATVAKGWRVDEDGSAFCWVDDPEYGAGWMPNGEVPAYTDSLDAAMTLVPEGVAWTLGQNVHHGHWQASVNHLDDEGAPESVGCSNATGLPALALTAACLRALAQSREAQAGGGA